MRRLAPILLVLAVATPAAAKPHPHADPTPAPAVVAVPVTPEGTKVTALLDQLAANPATPGLVEQIDGLAPQTVDAIGAWLQRPHASSEADRRAALEKIKAAVPDKSGHFVVTERERDAAAKGGDLDWLPALQALASASGSTTPGLGDVLADDVALRALAASKDLRAAQVIFDAAFAPDTMIYRDECGRYLRKMEPYSLPALTRESQGKEDRKRYATWQLERLDRQEPFKALAATTGVEAVTIALLDAFRETHHREAVHAVWSLVASDSPRVRETARAAWMAYVTGPEPPPAPKAKLKLPGGKETKKAKPLWLTYRELADNELRKAANELLHEDYPLEDPDISDDDAEHEHRSKTVKVDLEDLTKRLFAYYDGEAAKKDAADWAAAQAKASSDMPAAIAMVDRMLVQNPDRPQKAEMAKLYVSWGKQLEGTQKWDAAAAAYSKAVGLDPGGAGGSHTLAAEHFTLGKALEAAGKDGGPEFRTAIALDPTYKPAETAAAHAASLEHPKPAWMLFAAAGAGAFAMMFFLVAIVRRRA
ncbi:MAG TPA: hypothetical protein VGM88_25060 [Kofleriaceae bacterium]|jgi:tetratricopeptide (TPR) repeat protein